MKPARFEYHRPQSLADAVAVKTRLESSSAVLAGGQSLAPTMRMRMARLEALIDLGAVADLAGIEASNGHVRVGAMTRTRELGPASAAIEACPLLRQAIVHVAHPVIRNRGTVGGSIARADPAAFAEIARRHGDFAIAGAGAIAWPDGAGRDVWHPPRPSSSRRPTRRSRSSTSIRATTCTVRGRTTASSSARCGSRSCEAHRIR